MTEPEPVAGVSLDDAIATMAAAGGVLTSHTEKQAVVVFGKPRNHVGHLLGVIVTAGLWLLIYIPSLFTKAQTRVILTVDDAGEIQQQNIKF